MFAFFFVSHLQAEVENLTMEECQLDEQIRFGFHAFADSSLLGNALFLCYLLTEFKCPNYCREMQERLRELSEDENNEK